MMDHMEHAGVFKKNYLVQGLPDATIEEIAGLAVCDTMRAGESLIEKGEKCGDLYVIIEGSVHVYSDKGDKLAESGPGTVLGEVALVDDGPRSANVVCVGFVRYARLPAAELRSYMARHKETGFVMLANLSRVLSMRLRKTDAVMEDLRAKTEDPWKNSF